MGALVWRIEGPRAMRSSHWDPLALAGIAPDDEYDSYANVLASKLKRGSGRHDIATYLTTALADPSDLITPTWRTKREAAANALIDWYEKSNAPR